MSIKNTRTIDAFDFANLADFRDWLNAFEETDLSVVFADDADYIRVLWIEETLSDGSTATNISIRS